MIKLVIAALFLCLAAFGFAWLVDHPGDVVLSWFGWRVETSTATAAIAVLLLIAGGVVIWRGVSLLIRGPMLINRHMKRHGYEKGMNALARGLVAVGAGDAAAAQKAAREADKHLRNSPLSLLLRSQAAQLSGDREAANASFRAMLDHKETQALGLRGLYVEAKREGDHIRARGHAEQAHAAKPSLTWAAHATLAYQAGDHDWEGALATIKRQADQRLISRERAKRLKAVVLTAKALDLAGHERSTAKALAIEAHHAAPDLVPAAALAAKLLSESGEVARASKIIEGSWRLAPHPDLAEAYAHVRLGDSAQDRIKRVKVLANLAPDDRESAFALAAAYMEAREFDQARQILGAVHGHPTKRHCLLMAHLSEAEGKEGEAREWFARAAQAPADPAWTADGMVCDRWLPMSPVTGDLDVFAWQAPLAPPPGARIPTITLPHVPAPLDVDLPALVPSVEAPPTPIMPATGSMPPDQSREADRAAAEKPAGPVLAAAAFFQPPSRQPFIPDDPGPLREAEDEERRRR